MLQDLIKYTKLADFKIIATFLGAGKALPQAESLFSHILNAQHIWICRIKGIPSQLERFEIHEVNSFEKIHTVNVAELEQIATSSDLDALISYSTFSGESFQDKVRDILFHVVNHSTYHRAQVASQFNQNNIQPPVTDFIALRRQGLV